MPAQTQAHLAASEAGSACAPFNPAAQQIPLVDGSLSSLAELKSGDPVLLDLSGARLVGRSIQEVAPPLCTVGGKPGALYVDLGGFVGWSRAQVVAWRKLDALVERLDHAADDPTGYFAQLAKRDLQRARRGRELAAKRRANARQAGRA